jgi:hypothetical protein
LFKQESKRVLAVLPMIEGEKKRALLKKIEELKIPTHQFIYFSLEIYDTPYMGVMLLSSEKALQDRFVATLL